jgi:hypothetical protein
MFMDVALRRIRFLVGFTDRAEFIVTDQRNVMVSAR